MDKLNTSGMKIGFNGLNKPAAAANSNSSASTAPGITAKYGTDALVRTSQVAASGGSAADIQRSAEVRLANAYDANPETFARNLAQSSLEEMVSSLG